MLEFLRVPLFTIFGFGISWRDIILIWGGLFLMAKATHEIHGEIEPHDKDRGDHDAIFLLGCGATRCRRPGIFHRFHYYRHRHGREHRSDGRGCGYRNDREVYPSRPVSDFIARHPATKAGAGLSYAHRRSAGGQWLRRACPKGLHLLRHGFCRRGKLFNVLAARQRRRAAKQKQWQGAEKWWQRFACIRLAGPRC